MMLDTVLGLLAGVIILGILIGQHVVSSDAAALQLTAVIVTNTIYEAFLMFLLGYGLFEFPRRFWLDSDVRNRLERVYIKASSDFKDISDAHINISQEVANALKTKEGARVERCKTRSNCKEASGKISQHHATSCC